MTNEELQELMDKGKQDGVQLFKVANAIYKVSIILNFIIAIAGVILFAVAINSAGFGPALAVAIVTAAICTIGYALAVLGSNSAKVLVHLLFSNLALLQKQRDN